MVKSIRNLPIIIISSFLVLNILTIISPNINAQDIFTVGPGGPPLYNFGSINDALSIANESDIINVYAGTYIENIIINKSITIHSVAGSGSTLIISSNSNLHTIEIISNNVIISGFTLKNLDESFSCVKLNSVTSCMISNCQIKNGGNGLYLIDSNSNNIEDNTIENNNIGVYLWNSNSNLIKSNYIQNNNANGVFLSSTSSENILYLNDFSENPDSNARDDGDNNWDYGTEGNYWDDYNDYDVNKDGIGDNPYLISGNGGNQDNFPLGDFLSLNEKPIVNIETIDSSTAVDGQTVSGIITISGTSSDSDGTITLVEIKIDSGNWLTASGTISWSKSWDTNSVSNGQHTIYTRSKDNDASYSNIDSLTVNVQNDNNNQPPSIEITYPIINQILSGIITIMGNAYDSDGIVTIVEVKTDDGNWQTCSGINSWSFIWDTNSVSNGQHTIAAQCKDDDGEWSSQVSKTLTILQNTSPNNPPVAYAKGPYIGLVNQSITFDGSSSFDLDSEDALYYNWDFGDGTTAEGVIIGHIYNTTGNYSIELTVTDEHGLQSKNTTYATVSMETNGKNNYNGENKDIPGFEIIYVLLTISFLLILRKMNNKKRRF